MGRIAIAIVAVLFAVGCDTRAPIPRLPRRPSLPPASPVQALQRVRGLRLSARFEVAPDLGVPAIRSKAMAPAAAYALWRELHAARRTTGLTPVVLDARAELERPPDRAQEIAHSRALTVGDFWARRGDTLEQTIEMYASLAKVTRDSLPSKMGWPDVVALCRRANVGACIDRDYRADALASLDRLSPAVLRGGARREPEFAFVTQNETYAKIEQVGGPPMPRLVTRVYALAAPPHLLPIYLGIGGWNECPHAHEHAAVLLDWQHRFGARLVFVGGDTLELLVDRPPKTLADLKAVAREQYLYCADIVDQGTGSVEALAREIAGKRNWFFWWD